MMTELQQIEMEVLQINGRITLRPTVILAQEVGEKLIEARKIVPHGEWLQWLRRVYLPPRTAQLYISMAKSEINSHSSMTITEFLRQIRVAKRASHRQQREEAREEAKAKLGDIPQTIKIHHADCAEFKWPKDISILCTDPPWADLGAYQTLAKIATTSLRPGGLLMVQCGVSGIGDVMATMKGLDYIHTLAIVYSHAAGGTLRPPFQQNWRPVLMFSRGTWDRRNLATMSDTYSVRDSQKATGKTYHDWQQAEQPFAYWISRLSKPGDLIADPYLGSGTTPLVCKKLGLQFVGTEIDRGHYEVARGRLRSQTSDSRPTKDLGDLGTLDIDDNSAKATSEVFRQVSKVDRKRKLMVCRSPDARAKNALSRGVAVLLLPEIQ